MYYDYLNNYTYENIMETALEKAPSDVDKRQGSIIFDAIAPFSVTATNLYIRLYMYYHNTNIMTAGGEALNILCGNFGLTRLPATYAVRLGLFTYDDETPFNVKIGQRFSTISETSPIYYTVISKKENGQFLLQCDSVGTIGNEYVGNLLPMTQVNDLGRATLVDIITPAQDTETDEAFRARAIEWLRKRPYGGNIAHYKLWATEFGGIGGVQVYPVWDGGGTVKISIIDSQQNPCSESFLAQVKEYFDPEEYTQQGFGVAPIGHNVTVSTPIEVEVNVSATVLVETGYTLSQLQDDIEESILEYLQATKNTWAINTIDNQYNVAVYRSLIIAKIISIPHILNVQTCLINGLDKDLVLQQSAVTQRLPKIGSVVLSSAT